MNPKLLLFSFLLISSLTSHHSPLISQVPQGFNYQAIARDGTTGNPLIGVTIKVKISVLSDTNNFKTGGGVYLYEEEHTSVKTNNYGTFTVVLGNGTYVGGPVTSFNLISWTSAPLFIGTKIAYPATNPYKIMGSAKLWSVPYAMAADNLAGPVKKLAITASSTSGMEETLFEVKNKTGQTVFAVYNEGVRIYVDNGVGKAGTKGGFAIGGFGTAKAASQPLLVVDPDSIRAYIGTNPDKGLKGGFAIGGFSVTKASPEEYLRVTRDSTRVSVRNAPDKGLKGGFAIGGFNAAKTTVDGYLNLTPENYYIGHRSGLKTTSGINNSVLGFESGFSNTEGRDNVFIGYHSGFSNKLGLNNIFIGTDAGYSNIGAIQTTPYYLAYGSENIFIGKSAGYSNISGWTNLFVGNSSGYGNIDGTDNTFVGNFSGEGNISGVCNAGLGAFSGRSNQAGQYNVYVGFYSGNRNTSDHNTFMGAYAGENNIAGNNNTMIGNYSGRNSTGSGNVFIGAYSGMDVTLNNTLIIDNSSSSPLIFGDFTNNRVVINGNSLNNINSRNFFVNGSAGGSGAWWNDSDERLKTNIVTIDNALGKVLKLRGVYFEWKNHDEHKDGPDVGFIAQEAAEVIPEIVNNSGGTYSMQYAPITALLVEAMKEQQQQIETQKNEIQSLREEIQMIRALLSGVSSK